MEKTYGDGRRGDELRDYLLSNSESTEEREYFKSHDSDEGVELRAELAEEVIQLKEIEAEKKEAIEDFKYRMKPHQDKIEGLAAEIKDNGKYVTGLCYKMINYDEGEVGYYNEDGVLVLQRPMTSKEKQLNVFVPVEKTGKISKAM